MTSSSYPTDTEWVVPPRGGGAVYVVSWAARRHGITVEIRLGNGGGRRGAVCGKGGAGMPAASDQTRRAI